MEFLIDYFVGVENREIQEQLAEEVKRMKEIDANFAPGLAIVQVGGREDSNVYIRMKIKAATNIGMHAEHVKLPRSITEAEVHSYLIFKYCLLVSHVYHNYDVI